MGFSQVRQRGSHKQLIIDQKPIILTYCLTHFIQSSKKYSQRYVQAVKPGLEGNVSARVNLILLLYWQNRIWGRKTSLFFLLILIIINPLILLAQNQSIKFEHLGLEHGLSQSTVYCMLQDRQGFMWFGTQSGVNKYDGYKFTVYQQDVFDSTSLAQNVNNVMCEDHTGTLWFGSMNAAVLNRFERETERFTRFSHDPNNPHSLSNGSVSVIYEDHTGTLWVGTSNGLNRFDGEQEQFTRFSYDPEDSTSLHGYSVFSLYEDRSGTLWIGTERWLNKFDREKELFIHYQHDPQNPNES